ncbi:Long chain acyl-CoA synthetase 7, peroxisomal [Phytophthora fragariae]|uniref:Long-chain-fatty-acid--CoA ligase n=2 Tax=Phytophthora fragariae TaxID=53985 RepID=A0A6G0SB12_9STRA|nr:Long chain acyl-CoA synthetase 7, peroxisomal [Phytophthora fragariae]
MGAGSSSELPMSQIDFESYTGRRYTVEVPNTRDATHGPAYEVPDKEPIDEAEMTLYHNFLRGCSIENGSRPLYGRRTVDPSTDKAGAFEWLTYNEVKTRVERVASGLKTVGALERQDVVGVFSKNQLEWCLAAHACDRMSYVLVPLYDTLGPDAVPFIVNHTELRVLFCGKKQFDVVMDCVKDCPTLKIIVQFEPVTEQQIQQAAAKNLELRSLDELELLGEADPKRADPPKPSDVSTLCYTSGTTGDPKGVILLQRNYAYVVRQMCKRIHILPSDVHCSYLPLAHVFERAVLGVLQAHGASAGFYQGDLLTLMDDLVELQPTVFVSVPRLFNRVYDKITQGVAAAGGLKKILFERALAAKLAGLPEGHKTHALWDALVFSKVRLALGGRVRLIFSGSAPLSGEVKEFMKVVFCCDVAEGYGLSETAAAVTVGSVDMPTGPHVGCPLMYGQVQLEDVPEMGYTSRDKPRPRGEILVRGPVIFAGYYKEPEKTREAIDERGWFHTGDIGCWNADGTLSIIDRKKNIFKLAQGEYVAAEKIENIYAKSKFVAQIFAYGDSLQSCLVGIVVPDPETAEAWAHEKGLSGADASTAKVVGHPEFQKAVLADMARVAKEAKLRGFEFVKTVHFHPEPFSLEQGLITPTFKLKRPQLKAHFQEQIAKLYEGLK